jgi:hypothetical protein
MADIKPRDRWDKLAILLDPLGKILTAMVVVFLGYFGNKALEADQRRRAYVELLSRREEADNNLRKDMFAKVIDQFVTPGNKDLESRILNLQLLAYNFHESIDLGPLLKQIYTQSVEDTHATSRQRKRLQNLAQEIVSRELGSLREASCTKEGEVRFDDLESSANQVRPKFLSTVCAERRGLPARRFVADVMSNPQVTSLRQQTEVDVVLRVWSGVSRQRSIPLGQGAKASDEPDDRMEFTVSPFDFPMIDNVRLGGAGGRVSIVMSRVDDGGVTLTLVYFPDSRTSLRDKPFQDEVLKALDDASTPR